MAEPKRLNSVMRATLIHLTISAVTAAVLAAFIFVVWYPSPYGDLSGGKTLFALVLTVDVICGPLLTGIIFNPQKPKKELLYDIGLVIAIQLAALIYGVHSVWLARPLFLVMEVDRFKVVAGPDLVDAKAQDALSALPDAIAPKLWRGPQVVAIRPPKNAEERKSVLFESIQGGRDYAQRPEFYIPYSQVAAQKAVLRAHPIAVYISKYNDKGTVVDALAKRQTLRLDQLKFLPVVGRTDWIAVLNPQGNILEFLPGDGF